MYNIFPNFFCELVYKKYFIIDILLTQETKELQGINNLLHISTVPITITAILLQNGSFNLNTKKEKKMKIICYKEHLHQAIQIVQKAIHTKAPSPILTGIYISTENNKIELQATNYEISIKCSIDAQIIEHGSIVLSGKYMQEIIRRLPGGQVQISNSEKDNTIQIISNQAQFNLLSLASEEFPVLKHLPEDNKLAIQDIILQNMIKKTVFSCANDDSRPIFTGCLFETDDQGMRMAATNTHRMALKKETVTVHKQVQMIIPAKVLIELSRMINFEEPTDIHIYWYRNQIAFEFKNVYIISRLIEGQFPDYNKVIPKHFTTSVIVNSEDFFNAITLISLLSRDSDYNVIKLTFSENEIIISSNNPDIGKATETLSSTLQGECLTVAFNSTYLTDIMKNIDTKEIEISLNTPLSPACIKQCNDDQYIYIVTPVRTN